MMSRHLQPVFAAVWVTLAAANASAQTQPPAAAPTPAPGDHGLGLLPGGSLDLTATPGHVVLGRDARVVLDLQARAPDGSPLVVEDLVLLASTGAVERVDGVGAGAFKATWRPPKQAFPHVAHLWASARAGSQVLWGTTTIALWGQGQLTVETKPDAVMTLRVGDAAFGPVSANSRGVAVLTVVAPPGPTRAVAEVVDPAGNETKQTVDLGVPSFNRLAAFGPRDVVAGQMVDIAVSAVDRRGTPLPADTPLDVDVQGGASPVITPLRAGVWRLAVRAPDKASAVPVRVTVGLTGHKDSQASVTVAVKAGPAARAVVSILPPQARAGAQDRPTVTARVVDVLGNASRAPGLTATVEPGTLSNVVVDRDAVLHARWEVPQSFGGKTQGVLTIRDGLGATLASVPITLRPAPPTTVTATTPVPHEGSGIPPHAFALDVAAKDQFGNARPDAVFTVRSPHGVTEHSRHPNPDGSTRLILVPAPQPDRATVAATIQTDTGARVAVTLPAHRPVGPFVWAGLRGALAWNLGRLVLPGVGLDLGVGVPLPLPVDLPVQLALTAHAHLDGHAATPLSLSIQSPWRTDRLLFTAPTSVTLGGQLTFRRLVVGASAGAGVVFVHARVRQPGQRVLALWGNLPRVPQVVLPDWGEAARLSNTAPGLAARLFGGVRVGPGAFYVDARLDVPLVWGASLHGFTGGPVLGAGYALMF